MIAKSHKFPMRRQFYVWRQLAQKTHTPHLLFYSHPSPQPRVAVIIPAKIIKKATARNSLRRKLLDQSLPLALACGCDLVIILKSYADPTTILSELTQV